MEAGDERPETLKLILPRCIPGRLMKKSHILLSKYVLICTRSTANKKDDTRVCLFLYCMILYAMYSSTYIYIRIHTDIYAYGYIRIYAYYSIYISGFASASLHVKQPCFSKVAANDQCPSTWSKAPSVTCDGQCSLFAAYPLHE